MFTFQRCSLAAAAVAVMVALGACGGDDKAKDAAATSDCVPKYELKTPKSGVLRVATIQYPPNATIDGKSIGGVDGEIMKGFAKEACLDVEGQETTFAAAVSSVTSGRADVAMGDLTRTKARADEVPLSDPVYVDQFVIVSKDGLPDLDALEGKKIATVQGANYNDSLTAVFGKNMQVFPDVSKMYQDLFAGRVEAVVDIYAASAEYMKERGKADQYKIVVPPADDRVPVTGSEASQSGIAYSRDVDGLGDSLNDYLKTIREDGRLQKILEAHGLPAQMAETGDPRLL